MNRYGNRLELDELEIDKQKWMEPVTEEEDVARQEDETFEGRRFDFEGKERYGSDGEGKYDPVSGLRLAVWKVNNIVGVVSSWRGAWKTGVHSSGVVGIIGL